MKGFIRHIPTSSDHQLRPLAEHNSEHRYKEVQLQLKDENNGFSIRHCRQV